MLLNNRETEKNVKTNVSCHTHTHTKNAQRYEHSNRSIYELKREIMEP